MNLKLKRRNIMFLLLFFVLLLPSSYSLDITTPEIKHNAGEGVNIFLEPVINATYANYTTYWGDRPPEDYDLLVPYIGATDDVDLGTYNLEADEGFFNENVTADYFLGDGSQLTGITEGIWVNDSGTAVYQGDTLINGSLTVGGISMSGLDGEPELSYSGDIETGDSPSVFDVKVNVSSIIGSPFSFTSYINETIGFLVAGLVLDGHLGSYTQQHKTQYSEGIRLTFDEFSPSQSGGMRIYKGLNNIFKQTQHSGGTYTTYGVYNINEYTQDLLTGGTINRYGSYNEMSMDIVSSGSPTINEYGFYSKSFGDLMLSGTSNRYGLYLDGYLDTPFDNAYAIWVDSGMSRFDDVNVTDDLEVIDDVNIGGELQGARESFTFSYSRGGGARYAKIGEYTPSAGKGYIMPRDGSIVSVSVRANSYNYASAGNMDAEARIGGVSKLEEVIWIDGSGDFDGYETQARGVDTFVAGNSLEAYIDIHGTFSIEDVVVVIEVQYDE